MPDDGVYPFEDCLDDDGPNTDPVTIRAAVTVSGDSMQVDLAGSSALTPSGPTTSAPAR